MTLFCHGSLSGMSRHACSIPRKCPSHSREQFVGTVAHCTTVCSVMSPLERLYLLFHHNKYAELCLLLCPIRLQFSSLVEIISRLTE